ncbi:hypothetical protein [Streptomyces violaceusniger]|uniref:hypothetical protein n=1 Tax=Streptomyces violaceusniger TaxID=68280 RepID=UPI0036B51B6C
MTSTKTAAERVAAIRKEQAAIGEPVDHLSDLEVLNLVMEVREAECITIRDRYMGLLTSLRKNDEAVRKAAVQGVRERIDILATEAVARKAGELDRILIAVEALPERVDIERLKRLKQIAADIRHMMRLHEINPTKEWRLDDNRALVNAARHVVGILGDRDGITADEVIRLVKEALEPNGNLRDLFDVVDSGTLKPHLRRQDPPFMGPGWHDRNSYYAYEPAGGARVVAYSLGNDWHLDLYSPAGRLLAYGTVPADQVADLAPALVARAPEWAAEKTGYAWRRFANTINALHAPLAA